MMFMNRFGLNGDIAYNAYKNFIKDVMNGIDYFERMDCQSMRTAILDSHE